MKDKTVRKLLFADADILYPSTRTQVWTFPALTEDDEAIRWEFPSCDGIILSLLKKMKKMEKRIAELEMKSQWGESNDAPKNRVKLR